MIVENINDDDRFASNEILQNLGIVSYAGANMTTTDGQVIGQVCLIGYEERHYSPEEQQDLEDFADTAMEILELRQQVQDAPTPEVEA